MKALIAKLEAVNAETSKKEELRSVVRSHGVFDTTSTDTSRNGSEREVQCKDRCIIS